MRVICGQFSLFVVVASSSFSACSFQKACRAAVIRAPAVAARADNCRGLKKQAERVTVNNVACEPIIIQHSPSTHKPSGIYRPLEISGWFKQIGSVLYTCREVNLGFHPHLEATPSFVLSLHSPRPPGCWPSHGHGAQQRRASLNVGSRVWKKDGIKLYLAQN